MSQPKQLVNGNDLREFAAEKLTLWSRLVGTELKHLEWGRGRIVKVEQRYNYIPLIYIEFERKTAKFNSQSFENGKSSLLLDASLARKISDWRIEKEEKERERLIQETCAAEEERRRILARKAREAQEKAARSQVIKKFYSLAEKYKIPAEHFWVHGGISPLCAIVEKLEAKQPIDASELDWLKNEGLFNLLATIFYRDYRRTSDPWDLIKACKYLRKAGLSDKVISVTDRIAANGITDKRILSALYTTQGGAFRDLHDLEVAKDLANDAIDKSPESFHPYNLMGAILYEEGSPEKGDQYFSEAEKLGSSKRNKDIEIRKSLGRSSREIRRKVIDYLLSKDSTKYSWARKHYD